MLTLTSYYVKDQQPQNNEIVYQISELTNDTIFVGISSVLYNQKDDKGWRQAPYQNYGDYFVFFLRDGQIAIDTNLTMPLDLVFNLLTDQPVISKQPNKKSTPNKK